MQKVVGCDIRLARFKTLKGGCSAKLPLYLVRKKAILNPNNKGKDCFIWAFLIGMHANELKNNHHRERVNQYIRFKNIYDFSTINFPTSLKDIRNFEKKNSDKNFAINVFGLDNEERICGKSISPFVRESGRTIVNILYVQDKGQTHGHYMTIVNFSRIINSKRTHKKHLCYNCLNLFGTERLLKQHQHLCFQFKSQKVSCLKINQVVKYLFALFREET